MGEHDDAAGLLDKACGLRSALKGNKPVKHGGTWALETRVPGRTLLIVPPQHVITPVLVRKLHTRSGHAGCKYLQSLMQTRFWIPQGQAVVKRILDGCIICKRRNARQGSQQMAPLPEVRTKPGWGAFEAVGLDFFGPFYVRERRKTMKRFACIFTCMKSRAVHIELTEVRSTDSFMMALQRFIARRGQPKEIYSDNVSNFKGAAKEIREQTLNLDQNRLRGFAADREFDWKFGPVDASHWGGVWKRLIKSVRSVLGAILGKEACKPEVLYTAMCEVERILNSRPITALPSEAEGLEPLTPNHLLLAAGRAGNTDGWDVQRSKQAQWREVNRLVSEFWSRWQVEYLDTLRDRKKWKERKRNLTPGELVLLRDETCRRNLWPMGLIQKVHPGTDGLVREVTVRTAEGVVRRDVRKICPLETACVE